VRLSPWPAAAKPAAGAEAAGPTDLQRIVAAVTSAVQRSGLPTPPSPWLPPLPERVALAELPERRRDVFVLRVLEGMKMVDVARALSISTRAAEKHQAKALAHVAAALEGWRDS